MDYKDLRSIQESYNSMYSEEVVSEAPYGVSPNRDPMVPKSHNERMKEVGDRVKKQGVFLPPYIGPEPKRVKSKPTTQMAGYEPEGEMVEGLADMVDKATKAGQSGLEKMGVKINRTSRPTARPSVRTQDTMRKNQSSMEEVDVFDIIKGHLIDEGFADTEEAAHSIMASMSEGWKESIVETIAGGGYTPNPVGNAIRTGAGLLKGVMSKPSVQGAIKTGSEMLKKKAPTGGSRSTPKTPVKKPSSQAPMRDEPLW